MEFRHILEAIAYAQETGDRAELENYVHKQLEGASQHIMPILSNTMRGDEPYFTMAYAEALLAVHKASLSDQERRLVDDIAKSVTLMVIKAIVPVPGDNSGSDDHNES